MANMWFKLWIYGWRSQTMCSHVPGLQTEGIARGKHLAFRDSLLFPRRTPKASINHLFHHLLMIFYALHLYWYFHSCIIQSVKKCLNLSCRKWLKHLEATSVNTPPARQPQSPWDASDGIPKNATKRVLETNKDRGTRWKAPLLKWKSGRRFVSWHNVGDRLSAAKCRTLACSQPMCSQSSFCRNLPQIKEDSKDAQHTTSRHKDANDNVSMKMVISHQSTHFSCFASKPKSILASVLCSSFFWEPHELLGYWQLTHLLHKQFHTSVPLCDWLLKWGLTAFMGTLEKRS